MIKFINKNFFQHTCTSKPSKNGGTVYMTDILPVVTTERQKPICRIYSTTDELSAPIWDYAMKCQNRFNEVTKNLNTNFDVILDSDEKCDSDTYILAALPFNGIITSVTASDNIDILNGCFSKVTPFTFKPDDKTKYTKIVYLLLYVKSGKDIEIKFDTESVSFAKGSKQTKKNKSMYTNTLSINIDDIDPTIDYACENERSATVSIDEEENHISPKFSSILNARIDVRIGGGEKNNNTHKPNKAYEKATFEDIATVKSSDKCDNNDKRGGRKGESAEKAMKKLNKCKNRFSE